MLFKLTVNRSAMKLPIFWRRRLLSNLLLLFSLPVATLNRVTILFFKKQIKRILAKVLLCEKLS